MSSSSQTVRAGAAPPEPDLTRDEMVARAAALRPRLIAAQEATERRTYYSREMHEAFLAAGFYHLYVPRRYGGYAFDVPTYVRVVQEVARGCSNMLDVEVGGGTPGWRLHGDPMYSGRAVSIFTISLGAVCVGAAYNALDEYERLMRDRKTPLPPFVPRIKDPDYQRWYGRALTHIATAEAALHEAAARHMELCRRNVEAGIPYTFGDDMLLGGIAREVVLMCWKVIDEDLWQTVGASVARDGERTTRVFRDIAVAAAHRNLQLRDMFYGDIGRAALGEPQRVI